MSAIVTLHTSSVIQFGFIIRDIDELLSAKAVVLVMKLFVSGLYKYSFLYCRKIKQRCCQFGDTWYLDRFVVYCITCDLRRSDGNEIKVWCKFKGGWLACVF